MVEFGKISAGEIILDFRFRILDLYLGAKNDNPGKKSKI